MKRYDVIIGGNKTTLLLSDSDAAARGLTPAAEPVDTKTAEPVGNKAKAPANKARKPASKRAAVAALAFGATPDPESDDAE